MSRPPLGWAEKIFAVSKPGKGSADAVRHFRIIWFHDTSGVLLANVIHYAPIAPDDFSSLVRGAIIDDQHFDVDFLLRQNRIQSAGEIEIVIVGGYDNANTRRITGRKRGHRWTVPVQVSCEEKTTK